jgi:hypothetical protein
MQENAALRTFPFMKLDVYAVAKELAVKVQYAPIRDAELRDQATRAAKSAFLNLSEGLPSDSAVMRKKFFAGRGGELPNAGQMARTDCGKLLRNVRNEKGDPTPHNKPGYTTNHQYTRAA